MGNNSNDPNAVRQVYTVTICLPTKKKKTTTSLLSQSLCLKKFAEDKMGLKLSRTTKHQVTQNGLVHESRLNQIFVT